MMSFSDWIGIIAIIFSVFAIVMSWKWASDSDNALREIRNISVKIEESIENRTREIERRVEDRTRELDRVIELRIKEIETLLETRTKDIERTVDERTRIIEHKVEERLLDLIKRAAPSIEDKAMGDFMSQLGPEFAKAIFSNPELFKMMMTNNKSK